MRRERYGLPASGYRLVSRQPHLEDSNIVSAYTQDKNT